MAYIIRNIKTKEYIRASATCQRDLKENLVTALRAFSGEDPFFTVKIGNRHTGIVILTFLCGAKHKKCVDTDDTYEWTGISLSEAREQKMEFSEPGYIRNAEIVKVKSVKAKTKVKPIKAIKVAEVTPEEPSHKIVQSDDEFAAEIEAEFQNDLAKAALAHASK